MRALRLCGNFNLSQRRKARKEKDFVNLFLPSAECRQPFVYAASDADIYTPGGKCKKPDLLFGIVMKLYVFIKKGAGC